MASIKHSSKKEVYRSALSLISTISSLLTPGSKLTPSEIDILAEFLIIPTDFKYYHFSYPAKVHVMNSLAAQGRKIERTRLNSVIYSLIDKKYLTRDEDNIIFFSTFVENLQKQVKDKKSVTYNVTLLLSDEHRQSETAGEDSKGS